MSKPQLPPMGKKPMANGSNSKIVAQPTMKKIVVRTKKP